MSKKVLTATEKPFAKTAVDGISEILKQAGFQPFLLESYKDPGDLLKAVADVDALIVRSDLVTPQVFEAAGELKIVVRAGAGYDNIDLKSATERGVVVMNTPGQNANAVAELVFLMMLYASRKGFSGKSGSELRGKALGLHAYGNVGRCMAAIAKGFGMEVLAFDPFVPAEKIREDGVTPAGTVEELYERSDFISLHLPKTKGTVGVVDYALLSRSRKGAMLLNSARAEVVDEPSLMRMFEERPGFRYATDVEPACKSALLEKFPGRLICTEKKMGAQTEEANINAGLAAARQIVDFFVNGDTRFKVN